jgi:nucleoid DNA-binding protein
MNKQEFIKHTARSFDIPEMSAEMVITMFATALQEAIAAGQSVTIDEIGQFQNSPVFPNGLNHHGIHALKKAMKKRMVSFTPSPLLTQDVA